MIAGRVGTAGRRPRRVLITGVSSSWGGRLAQALEADPSIETIVGLGPTGPSVALQRTEFVRADASWSILSRVVQATGVDTILHGFQVLDCARAERSSFHDANVIGTLNLLAAAGGPGSTVERVVVKSSTVVYGASARDPAWFDEEAVRPSPARTGLERSVLEAESYVQDFAEDNPSVDVAILRCADSLGPDLPSPLARALWLPVVPALFGFDPQLQLLDQDDVVSVMLFAAGAGLRGRYNVAGDGRLPWSEVVAIMGKRLFALPPLLTGVAAGGLRQLTGVDLPEEVLALLRYGRGVDTTKLKRTGFRLGATTAGAVERFARLQRRSRIAGTDSAYRYEHDVETFFRRSPAVRRDAAT